MKFYNVSRVFYSPEFERSDKGKIKTDSNIFYISSDSRSIRLLGILSVF